jgi:Tfp pilus assembly PilM family ATPase
VFRAGKARTGIDLGTSSVKLVRGLGKLRLERITHCGLRPWGDSTESAEERAAAALRLLMRQLDLARKDLGRLAVAIASDKTSIREVLLPPLTENELRQALPFEAKKHLNLEGMEDPVITGQILGTAPPAEQDGPEQTRVLLAAAPRFLRDFPVRVLARLGLEPEVIDLQPLAALNELFAHLPATAGHEEAAALLDLGARQATLHIASRQGGFLSRAVGPGAPPAETAEALATYTTELAAGVSQTLTFYRGRYRKDVGHFHLCGGGALLADLPQTMSHALQQAVVVLQPLAGLADTARHLHDTSHGGAQFVTACGLCRWWDSPDDV